MACAEQALLPAVRDAGADTLILADGFSCRTQIEQGGTGRRALHVAEALAMALDGPAPADRPEKAVDRPEPPSPARARLVTAGAALTATGTAAGGLYALLRRLRR
jgi:hypothetical protein